MTKYQACKKLKEWGFKDCGVWYILSNGRIVSATYLINRVDPLEKTYPYPLLEQLIPFAESLAEEKWPRKWCRGIEYDPSLAQRSRAYFYIRDDEQNLVWATGKDDWWAMFNTIQKIVKK